MVNQYLGHYMFKEIIKSHYATAPSYSIMMHSLEEINSLTYSAGYVPRAIKRKLQKQSLDERFTTLH